MSKRLWIISSTNNFLSISMITQRNQRFRDQIRNVIRRTAPGAFMGAPRMVNIGTPENKILSKNMAFRRNSKKPQRRTRRRRVIRRRRIAVTQPNLIVRKLKTVYNGSIDAGAGTIVVDQLALNGAPDPTLGLGSGQPLGFDQYHALYTRNCVIGYKLHIQICTTDNTNPVVMGFTPKTDSTALTAYTHYKECKGTVSTILTPDIDKSGLSHKGSVKKWMLRKGSNILDNAGLCGDATTNPTSLLYGHIWAQAMDGAANPASVRYILTLEQIVVFFQPLVPARS